MYIKRTRNEHFQTRARIREDRLWPTPKKKHSAARAAGYIGWRLKNWGSEHKTHELVVQPKISRRDAVADIGRAAALPVVKANPYIGEAVEVFLKETRGKANKQHRTVQNSMLPNIARWCAGRGGGMGQRVYNGGRGEVRF